MLKKKQTKRDGKKAKLLGQDIHDRDERNKSETARAPKGLNDVGLVNPTANRERAASKDTAPKIEVKKRGYESPDTDEMIKKISDEEVSIDSDDRDFIDNISWDTNSNEADSNEDENDLGTTDTQNPTVKNHYSYNYLMH